MLITYELSSSTNCSIQIFFFVARYFYAIHIGNFSTSKRWWPNGLKKLPEKSRKICFTLIVEDNIDSNEETLKQSDR